MASNPPTIWIIGSDHWPRAFLRAELIERGYEAVGFESVRDGLSALILRPAERPRLIVLDLRDQAAARPVAALVDRGVPVLAIGGATAWSDEQLRHLVWAGFLRRPVSLGAVADRVDALVGGRHR